MSPLIKYELQQFCLIEALRLGQVWAIYFSGSYSLEYTPCHQGVYHKMGGGQPLTA